MSMFDIIYLMAAIVVIAIVTITAYYIWDQVNTPLSPMLTNNGVDTAHTFAKGGQAIRTMDYGITFLIVTVGLVTVIMASMINVNPVFFFGSLIILIVMVMISAILSNTFVTVMSADAYQTVTAQFPLTFTVMSIYPTICLVISALVAIFMYSKTNKAVAGFG